MSAVIKERRIFEVLRNTHTISVRATITDTAKLKIELLEDTIPEEIAALKSDLMSINIHEAEFNQALMKARDDRSNHIKKLQEFWDENH